ncbi:MAG: DUF4270 domain-containing protein, partial [Muribaculaceae bacterium]|nr:DUF4270 domain-containing protein [Muribaculaceae bacterium]
MNISKFLTAVSIPVALTMAALSACSDDVNPIGGSIADSQVSIYVDSSYYNLHARVVDAMNIDARSTFNILGHIKVPEYGELSASYVARLMSAGEMNIPDSITVNMVDSMRVVFEVPRRSVVGDTLAPQQLTVYRLNRQLPDNITSDFNPEGYYNPQEPVGSTNYTLSGIAMSDSAFRSLRVLPVSVTLPRQWAVDIFNA